MTGGASKKKQTFLTSLCQVKLRQTLVKGISSPCVFSADVQIQHCEDC